MRTRLAWAALLAAGLLAGLAAVVLAGPERPGARALAADSRLPDLRQELPLGVEVTRAGGAWRLGFDSAVSNVGAGPLRISATRRSGPAREMVADQLVERPGARAQRVPEVGRVRYVRSRTHQHWHLLDFDRYELRRPGAAAVVVRDRKTGFCLGDRYELPRRAGERRRAEYRSRCGLSRPWLTDVRQGISVGFGDDYPANLEGQWLRLDGLPAGPYVLVHRADPGGLLRERTRSNNAASLLLDLRWRRGRPSVSVERRCPRSERCPPPQGATR